MYIWSTLDSPGDLSINTVMSVVYPLSSSRVYTSLNPTKVLVDFNF